MTDQPALPHEIEKAIRETIYEVLRKFVIVDMRKGHVEIQYEAAQDFSVAALREPIARLLAAEREKALEEAACECLQLASYYKDECKAMDYVAILEQLAETIRALKGNKP